MDRRKFLFRSMGGMVTAVTLGFPSFAKAQSYVDTDEQYFKYENTENKVTYELQILMAGVRNFTTASDDLKQANAWSTQPVLAPEEPGKTNRTKYRYRISRVQPHSSITGAYHVTLTCLNASGEPTPAGIFFQQDLEVMIVPNSHAIIESPVTGTTYKMIKMEPPEEYFYDAPDCFLTTACVHHKGLSDDGVELNTLRAFREDYMRTKAEGQGLLDRYYVDGPAILQAIEQQAQPGAYYEHMYQYLVQPSLALIEQNQKAEAMAYYRDYVLAIKSHLRLS